MRGMKKWLPFKSLNGQYQVLDQMKKEREKVVKPELSLDEIDDLNRMMVALKKGDVINVTYFDDGTIISRKCIFLKCDGYSQTIFFKGLSLPFRALMCLEN